MTSLRLAIPLLAALITSAFIPAASANSVLYWNEQVINATRLSRNPPPPSSMFLAAFHVAIFDAVNGITRTHQGWIVNDPAPAGADMDAAIAGAAYTILKQYWSQSSNPGGAEIPDGQPKTDGLAWGQLVAERVIEERSQSGFNKPIPGNYSSTEPGKWRETPTGFRPPVLPHWGKVKPFVMTSNDQFRAPPPPPIESEEHAKELAFVAKVGARDDAERDEYQTMSTPFWSDDLGTATPPGHWNVITQDLVRRFNLSVPDTARLYALLNLAEADAAISCWETKFHYSTWRPETALRELGTELNPIMVTQPDFIPNMASPAFPSYTSGHSTFSAAATRILERFFGRDDIEFTATSDGLPGAVRTYKSFSQAREEVGMSRVWGGIHTMSDNIEGQKAGIKIADWVFEKALQPLDKAAVAKK